MIAWYLAFPAGPGRRGRLTVSAARRRARLALALQAIEPRPRLRLAFRTDSVVRFRPMALRKGPIRVVDVTPTGAVWIHGVI